MPCYDPQSGQDDQIKDRLACYFLSTLEQTDYPIPEWAMEWWARHIKYDKAINRTREYDSILADIINNRD